MESPPKQSCRSMHVSLNVHLDNLLITDVELERSLVDIVNANPLPIDFISKLEELMRILPVSHILDASRYDVVCITSDTHSDFRKLIQLLSDAGIIKLPEIGGRTADPYTDDIYHPTLISETMWIPNRALFIIAGDLVDGCRECFDATQTALGDCVGSFEFLTHCFLYNLRIRALQHDSNVLFTIGNHDLHSVLLNDRTSIEFWEDFVDYSAKGFFGTPDRRKTILMPFYRLSPYFMLSIENLCMKTKEVAIVHGGFHDGAGRDLLTFCTMLQEQVRNVGLVQTVAESAAILGHCDDSPLWSRRYADATNRCDLVRELDYGLVVVGHCTTHSKEYEAFKTSKSTAKSGTIVLDCFDKNCFGKKRPKIAFVDVAMSNCFWPGPDNKDRRVEMLQLTRNLEFDSASYASFYNANVLEQNH